MASDTNGDILDFLHTLERCKLNKRTGWVNQGIPGAESIADHMYRMAMIALVLPEPVGDEPRLDISKCVMLCLCHDLAEADVGDITPDQGYTREQKLALEAAAMERILGTLGHPSLPSMRVKTLWEEYEARTTTESKFVKDLDWFELAVQGVEYENAQGARGLQRFFETTVPLIKHPVIKSWAHKLMAERRQKWSERGLEAEYVHVEVSEPLPAPNDASVPPRLPTRVYANGA